MAAAGPTGEMLLLHLFLLFLLVTGAGTAEVRREDGDKPKPSKFSKFLKFANRMKDMYHYVKNQTLQALRDTSFLPPANPRGERVQLPDD